MDNDPKQSAQFVAHSPVIPRRPWVLSKQGEMTYVLSQDGEVILGDRACKAMPEDMLRFLIVAANGYASNGKSSLLDAKEALKKEIAQIMVAAFTAGFDADNTGALDHFDGFALADAAVEKYWPNDPSSSTAVSSSQIVRDREPRYSKMELDQAVTACCTCGGGGPGEKHTCLACEMYHALVTVSNEKINV